MDKEKKIPATLGEAADQLYKLRQKRLEVEKQVAELKEQERLLREYLIENLPKQGADGIAGKLCRVNIVVKEIPIAEDWDAVHDYVRRNASKGGFAILQKRLNVSAVREILASGKTIPGVGVMETKDLSVTKK